MQIRVLADAAEFEKRAGEFLRARVERNVLATILQRIVAEGLRAGAAHFAIGVNPRGDTAFAALRVPPWFLLVTELAAEHAPQLVARWLEVDPEVPGVGALPEVAGAIAAAWSEQTGGSTRCRMRLALHTLRVVCDPPHPARGALRPAGPVERELLVRWLVEFAREARVEAGDAATSVDAGIARERLFVWDDQGPVAMVAAAPVVAGIARIGPVYTPPQFRRRGYAGSAVAALSRRALGQGAQQCALFTDLANPTSNKIYAEVGYRRVAGWEEHRFARDG